MTSPLLIEARKAIDDPQLQDLLDRNADTRRQLRESAFHQCPMQPICVTAQRQFAARQSPILAANLETFAARLTENGIHVHRAADGEEAGRIVVDIARKHGAELWRNPNR